MKNPPDFVMYVVMIHEGDGFTPLRFVGTEGDYIYAFPTKSQARRLLRIYQREYGKQAAYVQQYGPYS